MDRRGFTLVELAIVLVVVGLLIGGVLVGQSLIDTAKVNREIKLVGQFDAAVNSFQSKYGQLPGDTSLFGFNPGNNNGRIECVETDGGNLAYSGEVAKFWNDLSYSGFSVEGIDFSDYSNGSGFGDADLPNSKINEAAGFLAMGDKILEP